MKTILITGVSSGIGLGLTREFINSGYKVIGNVRNSTKASELQALFGKEFSPLVFDITNYWEIETAVKKLKDILGGDQLCGLVNNAGFTEIGPLLHVPINDVRRQFEVLVFSQLNVIQKFFPFLLPQDTSLPAGRIVNISSISGNASNYFFGSYCAAKHAFEGLSKTLREELKMYGVKVIVIAPGNIKTSLWGKQTFSIIEKYKGTVYYAALKKRVEHINSTVLENAINIEEFSTRFIEIFKQNDPAHRYTIVKKKFPFVKEKVVVLRK
jgi:NAD(P)-dependent dehydrogenase (short-subunit alcohol dehydrogenase family)